MVIGRKIIYCIFAITFLFVVGSFLAVRVARRELERSIGEQSTVLTRNILNEVDDEVANRIRGAILSFSSEKLKKYLALSNLEFKSIPDINAHMAAMETLWQRAGTEYAAPEIDEVLNSGMSLDFRKIVDVQRELSGYNVYGEVFAANRYGAAVIMTHKISDYRQDDEAWWKRAKDEGITIAPVTYDDSSSTYSVDVGIRIDNRAGEFLGVVKVCLNVEGVIKVIKQADAIMPYASSEIVLAEDDGRIIYSTDERGLVSGIARIDTSRMKGLSGYSIEEGDREKVMVTYARSPWNGRQEWRNWMLMISYSTEELFAPSVTAGNIILLCSSFTMIICLGLGFLVAGRVTAPLDKLKRAALSISEGNLDTPVEITSNDEVGLLAGSLKALQNGMHEFQKRVDAYSAELENRVKSRTTYLEKAKDGLEGQVREDAEQLIENHAAMVRMAGDLNAQAKDLKEAHEKLFRAKRLASMGVLAGMVGHELKNPLGVMNNSIYFLKSRLKKSEHRDEKMEEHLEILSAEVDNSTRIINEILSLGGIKKPNVSALDVCQLIEGVMKKVDIPENIEEVVNLFPRGHIIFADGHQLVQVLLNLMQNAVQAMQGGGKLTVSCRTYGQEEEISVGDTGSGIRPEDREKIFEPLFSTKSYGTGLGLAVCQSIVENHGGRIKVESGEAGKGTVFIVTLPISDREQGKNKGV